MENNAHELKRWHRHAKKQLQRVRTQSNIMSASTSVSELLQIHIYPRSTRWFVKLVSFAFAFGDIPEFLLGFLAPIFQEERQLSTFQIGILIGLFKIVQAFASLGWSFAAMSTEKNPKKLLVVGMFLHGIGCTLLWAKEFWQLCIVIVVYAIGSGSSTPLALGVSYHDANTSSAADSSYHGVAMKLEVQRFFIIGIIPTMFLYPHLFDYKGFAFWEVMLLGIHALYILLAFVIYLFPLSCNEVFDFRTLYFMNQGVHRLIDKLRTMWRSIRVLMKESKSFRWYLGMNAASAIGYSAWTPFIVLWARKMGWGSLSITILMGGMALRNIITIPTMSKWIQKKESGFRFSRSVQWLYALPHGSFFTILIPLVVSDSTSHWVTVGGIILLGGLTIETLMRHLILVRDLQSDTRVLAFGLTFWCMALGGMFVPVLVSYLSDTLFFHADNEAKSLLESMFAVAAASTILFQFCAYQMSDDIDRKEEERLVALVLCNMKRRQEIRDRDHGSRLSDGVPLSIVMHQPNVSIGMERTPTFSDFDEKETPHHMESRTPTIVFLSPEPTRVPVSGTRPGSPHSPSSPVSVP